MEGEISNFIKLWLQVLVSSFYCYLIAKFVPKGTTRLISIIPIICHFFILPFNLTTFHLGIITSYYISWLANFKLILFAFGAGPLSGPSLSLGRFVLQLCLPIKIKESPPKELVTKPQNNTTTDQSHGSNTSGNPAIASRSGLKPLWNYAIKAYLFLAMLVIGKLYKNRVNLNILYFSMGIYTYVGSELLLAGTAMVAQLLLGAQVEAQFGEPYLAHSLKDFWGRQWNIVSSDILCSTIFKPVLRLVTPALGLQWALALAVLGTFVVSWLMHELMFYHVGRLKPTWGPMFYFIINAFCLLIESVVRSFTYQWRLPRIVTGTLIFTIEIIAYVGLVIPSLLRLDVVGKTYEEYEAMLAFVTDNFWARNTSSA